jgi:hypothetical protein
MNRYRSKHTWLTLFTLVLLSLSCKKVLDVAPYTVFSDLTAFDTPARIEAAMNGVYDAAQSGFYASGQVRGYPSARPLLSKVTCGART